LTKGVFCGIIGVKSYSFILKEILNMLNRKYYAYTDSGARLAFEVSEYKEIITLTLAKEKLKGVKSVTLIPEISEARAGDEGFYILPRNISMRGDVQVLFTEREDATYTYDKPVMSLYGICKKDFCALVRIHRSYKYSFKLTCLGGVYTVAPVITFGGKLDPAYADIRIELIKTDFDKGLSAFALAERSLRLERGEITLCPRISARAELPAPWQGRHPSLCARGKALLF